MELRSPDRGSSMRSASGKVWRAGLNVNSATRQPSRCVSGCETLMGAGAGGPDGAFWHPGPWQGTFGSDDVGNGAC